MTAAVAFDSVAVGTELPALTLRFSRLELVMYAGACGDFNPIHWSERFAKAVGLPDVIAHGMLTMGAAGRIVTDWVGDPGAVVEYGVRFTRPVIVADTDTPAEVLVTAVVTDLLEHNRARITLTATYDGATVLGRAQAVVTLA